MFARWGRFVYRHRWLTLVGSALLLGLSIAGIFTGGSLVGNGGAFGSDLPAGQANKLIGEEIKPQSQGSSGSGMTLLFGSPTMVVTGADFEAALKAALAPLASDSRVTGVTTPYTVPAADEPNLISRDSHQALVVVNLKDRSNFAQGYYRSVLSEIHPGPLSMVATGQVPLNDAFNSTLESDLNRAEIVALPVSIILLILIFASALAWLLPIGVGLLALVGGVAGTLFLARFTDVSQYAINVVTLIGLAVAIDYSLFIVNRFRDELAAGAPRVEAVATAMATAGRAITFSGVTVAIGLSAMLFFPGTFLASMGAAGAIVVAVAVFYALTFLPALLSVMGEGVSWLPIPFLGGRSAGHGAWHSMALWVMKRPVVVLVPALAVLLLAGAPFLQLRLASSDVDALPPTNSARQGYDTLLRDFPGQNETTIEAVVYYQDSSPLTADHVAAIYDLSRRLGALPNVLSIQSIVNVEPNLTSADYQRLYSGPQAALPAQLRQALEAGSGPHLAVLYMVTNQQYTSDEARQLVRDVRAEQVPGGKVLATGETAYDLDIVNFIVSRTPIAISVVVLVTYCVLFLLTGSVVLPLKAVITNLFSISASFGALVFVFEQGHFASLLGFTAQSIDPSIPVILFSIVFGMSMDYEVLLISRIQEEYLRTHDNQSGVAFGLEKSGRLITGAAAIMVAVFISFGLAEVVIIKSIGVGLALAIVIDATIVRLLIVPSVMRILGRANWWAPRPLAALHVRLGAGDVQPVPHPDPLPAGR